MSIKHIINRILLSCLIVVFLTVQSGTAFAADKIAGSLIVTGKAVKGTTPTVNVNGEPAVSGRAIFSASLIETSKDSGVIINIGKLGKVKAAENTKFTITFDAESIKCSLVTGSLTADDSDRSFEVTLPDGKIIRLGAGETANAANSVLPAQTTPPATGGGAAWLPWALIVGGAAAALVIATATGGNDIQLSGSTIVVSPTR